MKPVCNYVALVASLIMGLTATASVAQWAVPSSTDLFVTGGWIFDGISDTRRRNSGILMRDGEFAAIDFGDSTEAAASATVIELSDDQTILPGMIDLHAHYNFDLVDNGRAEEVVHNGAIFLANGVTSTWSAGEYFPERVLEHRDLIDAGEATGPRLFASGPYFGSFRCEYNIKTADDDCIAWPNDLGEQELRAEVDRWAARGVISIKIKQASPGETAVLIEQAHKHGMTATGHLSNYLGEYDVHPRDAILMGLDRLEHQITLGRGGEDSAEMQQIIDMMIEHQVYYDPNLQMYGSVNLRAELGPDMTWTDEAQYFTPYARELLDKRGPPPPESDPVEFAQRMRELLALYESGGGNLIVVGTDEPVYTTLLPGFAFHRELMAQVHAGLPTHAVLKAATINGASALGIADRLGSIETGKLADLVVVNGNPLDDIKSTRDVHLVVKAGKPIDPKVLLESARDGIGPSGPDDHADWEIRIEDFR